MTVLDLMEEFKDYIKGKPVFYATKKKPITHKEMQEILKWKDARFIAISNKVIYIFPGDLLHLYVAEKLGIDYHKYWTNKHPIFYGEANIINGKIVYNYSYDLGDITSSIRDGQGEELKDAKFQLKRLSECTWDLILKYILGFDKELKALKHKNEIYNKE